VGFVTDFVARKLFNHQERCYPLVVATQSIRVRKEGLMTCKWCGSDRQSRFTAEVAIHFPGLEGLDKPIVWVFPELFLCLNCGKAEFVVPDEELRILAKD
jgi:transcription elongation factor Elf1